MSNSILARLLILVAMLPLLFVSVQVTADTFSVTAKDCTTSPGGYQWAIEQANNTPGRDTISIDVPLLYVDGCFHPERALLPIAFTESVDILGNGNTVTGVLTWVSAAGNVNPANSCPPPDAIWINPGGALFDVGIPGTDASGIELTITNVKMERLSTVGIVRKNAKLTIEDSQLTNIRSLHDGCTDSLIQALEGADLTLNNTSITLSGIPADIAPDVDFPLITSLISGTDGDLVMENVTIEASLGTNAASVHWHGGLVKIVSSSFFESHGFWLSDSTIDFVNSVFQNYDFSATFSDNIILNNGSVFRSEASTFYWATKLCPNCMVTNVTASDVTKGSGILGDRGTSVRFKSSALGSIEPDKSLQKLWGDPQAFNSDVYTWIQPTAGQDITALAAFLPSASTATPGLTTEDSAGYLAQTSPIVPGVLVEAVPNAATGGINELLSPIDGLPITVDSIGLPRVYANGTRNIGAVQNVDAPNLAATSADAQVILDWSSTPFGQALGYEICTSLTPLTDPLTGNCPGTVTPADKSETSKVISSLTNGTPYWFAMRAGAPGIWGNVATATPMGSLGIAQPTATVIGDGSVQVFWAEPGTTGGFKGLVSYNVVYRPIGTQVWLLGPQGITPRTTLLGGLVNATTYEVGIMAQTDDGGLSSTVGSINATPLAAPTLSYATASIWPQNTLLTLTPSVGQLQGAGAYTIESGALPDGLMLDPSTGVISGVPATQQSTSANIRLTDGITGLFTSVTLSLSIVAPSSSPQLGHPEIQATVGVGPVSATPTQSGIPAGAVWSIYPGDSLPAGFGLDPATGVISGTPTAAPGRVVDITIQACWGGCDPNLGEVRLAPMLFFIVPNLQYPANTQATAGVAVTIMPIVSLWNGGVFSIESGSLPTGMSLDPVTGVISGTPQTASINPLTIRYSTGVNVAVPPLENVYSATQINVASPTIVLTYPAVTAYVGENLSVSPSVSGVTGETVYSIVSASLPQGLGLNPATGVITGVPTGTPGRYPVVIEVTDAFGSQKTSLVIELILILLPSEIPSLSEWGTIILTFITAVSGIIAMRRRKRKPGEC